MIKWLNKIKEIEDRKKMIYLIFFIILLIVLISGTSYALFNVQINSGNISGYANCYEVNYTKGQNISGELIMGTSYTSGKSVDIVMSSDPECTTLLGTLYLSSSQNSTMDYSDGALKYTVVVDNNVVSQGAVSGAENQVIYSNFALNSTDTTYKVYIWIDASLEDMSNFEIETYSAYIHADVRVTSDVE